MSAHRGECQETWKLKNQGSKVKKRMSSQNRMRVEIGKIKMNDSSIKVS